MIFFIHPHEESLFIVVEDTTSVRPVTSSATISENVVGCGLLEEESIRL
jgi:hypothetical protein